MNSTPDGAIILSRDDLMTCSEIVAIWNPPSVFKNNYRPHLEAVESQAQITTSEMTRDNFRDSHWYKHYVSDHEMLMGNIVGILQLINYLNIRLDSFDKLWFTSEELDIILNDEVVNRNYKYLREDIGVRL